MHTHLADHTLLLFEQNSSRQPTTSAPISKPSTTNTTQLSGPLAVASSSSFLSRRSPLSLGASSNSTTVESNPWLAVAEDAASAGKLSRKMNKATVGKDSRDAVRLAAKVDRHRSKLADAREADADDAQVDIDPSVVLSLGQKAAPQLMVPVTKSKTGKGSAAKATATARSTIVEGDAASSDEEDDEIEHKMQSGQGPAAFKQRDLVARAFAGDNVVAVRSILWVSCTE